MVIRCLFKDLLHRQAGCFVIRFCHGDYGNPPQLFISGVSNIQWITTVFDQPKIGFCEPLKCIQNEFCIRIARLIVGINFRPFV